MRESEILLLGFSSAGDLLNYRIFRPCHGYLPVMVRTSMPYTQIDLVHVQCEIAQQPLKKQCDVYKLLIQQTLRSASICAICMDFVAKVHYSSLLVCAICMICCGKPPFYATKIEKATYPKRLALLLWTLHHFLKCYCTIGNKVILC